MARKQIIRYAECFDCGFFGEDDGYSYCPRCNNPDLIIDIDLDDDDDYDV